jgi:hypothetical protein
MGTREAMLDLELGRSRLANELHVKRIDDLESQLAAAKERVIQLEGDREVIRAGARNILQAGETLLSDERAAHEATKAELAEANDDIATLEATVYSRDGALTASESAHAETKAELITECARTDALVASLPKCDFCERRPATRSFKPRGGLRYCDGCAYFSPPDYPRAAPLRALLAARAKRGERGT